MTWVIPDIGVGQNDLQSIIFMEYLQVLQDSIDGRNCVLSGCAVTAQGSPDMTVAVAKGAVLTAGVLKPVTAGNATITTADGTHPRLDLVVVNSSGTKAVRAGTAAANPKPPARTADDVVLAVVYVPASDTTIATAQIADIRCTRTQGPITIYKTIAAETTNTTSAAVNILDKTNSGVAIPSGLFLAGRQLRVRIWGNHLLNSGTPTLTLSVIFGGTTMFSDVTVAGVTSAARGAFWIDLMVSAQGASDQAMVGFVWFDPVEIARVAPTTGIAGNLTFANTSNRIGSQGFAGSSAVDADAADRTLQVQWTMSVNNAANEVVVEGASVELV